MGVKVAGNCFNWPQPLLPHHPSSSPQSLPSLFSPRSKPSPLDRTLSSHLLPRSPFLGSALPRSRSDDLTRRTARSLRRASSASLHEAAAGDDDDDDDKDEFVRHLQQLARSLQHQDCTDIVSDPPAPASSSSPFSSMEPPWPAIPPPDREATVPASVVMKANSVDLPLSLRIIKRRKKWGEEIREAGESACCSVKKAFSSMVFIVREIQSYTLQMREVLFYENIEGILARVQGEMNASFVWLFQQIFSCTPTLMVYVMLLLANFTVYSIGHNSVAIAASVPPNPTVISVEREHQLNPRFDASSLKSFSFGGRTASVGGNGGGAGKVKPVAGATDDGGPSSSSSSISSSRVMPDGISTVGVDSEAEMGEAEAEAAVWRRIVEEATRMQASLRDEALMDADTLRRLVSPVRAEMEVESLTEYSKTEEMYGEALSRDPENVLLLSNFAQFLYLVLHDHDRAEYYFKRAVGIKPADAEALDRYAKFLWLARNDIEAAEETYLEAIAADPSNSYYAANYANFLWNTGGEDTCYPLDGTHAC